jgi:TusA-related sulfurtransferase
MLREALVVDGTAKTCRGVIAGLERGMTDLEPGDVVLAIVEDIPTRLEVYAWAQRKSHRIVEERRRGAGYVMYIAKGAGNRVPVLTPTWGEPARTDHEMTEVPKSPGARA